MAGKHDEVISIFPADTTSGVTVGLRSLQLLESTGDAHRASEGLLLALVLDAPRPSVLLAETRTFCIGVASSPDTS
eukprot:4232738-Amphidinium_carterae.1